MCIRDRAKTARTVYTINSEFVYPTGLGGNITAMGNKKLKWERTKITDIGGTVNVLNGLFEMCIRDRVYYDATATKSNTLTPISQEIVAKLDGGMTITTYINALDPGASWYAAFYFLKPDMERFEQYLRFKPDMNLKYVYYYDTTANPQLDKRFPNKTLREKMVEVCKIYGLDSNRFMTPEQIRAKIDLSGEGNAFVRQIVRDNGEKAWLRIYADMQDVYKRQS